MEAAVKTNRKASETDPQTWTEVLEPAIARFRLAGLLNGTSASWNQVGSKAMADLLRKVAGVADVAVQERARAEALEARILELERQLAESRTGSIEAGRKWIVKLFGKPYTTGHWTNVARSARIGAGTILGDWSTVDEGSIVGRDVTFGSHARIGRGVVLGDRVVLGSHTIVQDGVRVPDDAVFDDCDLVTATGVLPNRTGGHAISGDSEYPKFYNISAPFGCFRVPADAYRNDMVEDFMWGRSDALEEFRMKAPPQDAIR
jgi:hypothetical protein